MDEGCYFVLPVLGPTTIRDAVGSIVNFNGGDMWYNVTGKWYNEYLSEILIITTKILLPV